MFPNSKILITVFNSIIKDFKKDLKGTFKEDI